MGSPADCPRWVMGCTVGRTRRHSGNIECDIATNKQTNEPVYYCSKSR